MQKANRSRRPYQFSLRELFAVTTVLAVSFGLIRWGLLYVTGGSATLMLSGVVLAGGVIGAIIGRAFEDERGGMASMGAFIGAIVIVPVLIAIAILALIVVAVVARCGGFGGWNPFVQ
jgi:hypothetical protein